MTIVFTEGFDKYGPNASSYTIASPAQSAATFLQRVGGDWTSILGPITPFIGPALSSSGGAFVQQQFTSNVLGGISKTLAGNYATAIGGFRFNVFGFATSGVNTICRFLDGATLQASIGIDTSGRITISDRVDTLIASSVASVALNSTHYLEWSIAMSNSATWTLYLDGVSILTGTAANFHGSANNYYNVLGLHTKGGAGTLSVGIVYDDLYIDDGAGAVLLTNPIVETHFPTSDSAVQFAPGAFSIGFWNMLGSANNAPGANQLFLRKVTAPAGGMTLNSVTCVPEATSAGANLKAVLYADSAGSPAALIATGAQVTGTTAGAALTSAFGSGQALTAATSYWIGFITDTSVTLGESDIATTSWLKTNTYASGAPNPAGTATSTTAANWCIWGTGTGTTTNNIEVASQAALGMWGDFSYVFDSVVGHEDLYGFAPLISVPNTIHAVCVKALLKNSAAGTRTVTLNTKSGATDSAGSNAGITPAMTYGWFGSLWAVDPNTSAAWTGSGVNAATSGFKITA